MIKLISFSYKKGVPQADLVLDCRGLENPHHVPELRNKDGRDFDVQDHVKLSKSVADLVATAVHAAFAGKPTIAFGCFGGRHRSVAMVEIVADRLRLSPDVKGGFVSIEIVHTELK